MDVRRGIVTEEREKLVSVRPGPFFFWLLQARSTGYLALPDDFGWRGGGASAAFYYWGLASPLSVLEDLV